jgi:hypothetical protein
MRVLTSVCTRAPASEMRKRIPHPLYLRATRGDRNLAWVAESAKVGPALWAEARPTLVCLARSRKSRYHATRNRHRV